MVTDDNKIIKILTCCHFRSNNCSRRTLMWWMISFWGVLLSGLRREHKSLKYIIDVTIGYMNGRPFDLLNNVITGDVDPCRTVIHYRKYRAATVPRSETMLTNWLYERFSEKDALLDHFYRTGNFPAQCANGSVKAEKSKYTGVLRPVSFSPLLCLLMHAFYILSTFLHLYLAICIWYLVWSWFG